jgi:hypothetical protein
MLILASATDKLQLITSTGGSINVHASYLDNVAGTVAPGRQNVRITTGTTTDVVSSPASGVFRNLKTLHVYNAGGASNDITVQHTDGTTVVQLHKVTLAPATTLQYVDEIGFLVSTISPPLGSQCRLFAQDATHLTLARQDGAQIRIGGSLYLIPAVGVTASPTGCFLNGVPGSVLSVGGVYNVYVFNNGGTPTLDFSATGHNPDTATGNEGTEVKTGDASRSLVGKVYIAAGPSFADSDTVRGTLTWFNRRQRAAFTTYAGTTGSTVLVDAGTATFFLCWGDEETRFTLAGNTYNNTVGATNYTNLYLDNSSYILPDTTWQTESISGAFNAIAGSYYRRLTEGVHYFNHRVAVGAGTGGWNVNSFVLNTG